MHCVLGVPAGQVSARGCVIRLLPVRLGVAGPALGAWGPPARAPSPPLSPPLPPPPPAQPTHTHSRSHPAQGAEGGGAPAPRVRHAHRHPPGPGQPAHPGGAQPLLERGGEHWGGRGRGRAPHLSQFGAHQLGACAPSPPPPPHTHAQGLLPVAFSPQSGAFTARRVTLGALGDSYYETLLKLWLQGGRREERWRAAWERVRVARRPPLLSFASSGPPPPTLRFLPPPPRTPPTTLRLWMRCWTASTLRAPKGWPTLQSLIGG